MIKFLKNQSLPLLSVFAGAAVLLLRLGHLATVDEKGLLASGHITGILAGVLSLLIPAVFLWRSLVLPKNTACCFPKSAIAAVGYGIGALGAAFTAIRLLVVQPDNLMLITGFAGVVAAISLGFLARMRWQGLRASVLYHAAVCLFFMLLLICQYRIWSAQPQLSVYGCSLFAIVCLLLGAYHRACLDSTLGKVWPFIFFRCTGIFFCLAAIPGSDLWILFLTGAVWSFADLLNLSVGAKKGG